MKLEGLLLTLASSMLVIRKMIIGFQAINRALKNLGGTMYRKLGFRRMKIYPFFVPPLRSVVIFIAEDMKYFI